MNHEFYTKQEVDNKILTLHSELNKRFDDLTILITPIADAFNFKKKMGSVSMTLVVNTAKIFGLVLSILALGGIIWKAFVYFVLHIK